MTRKPLPAEEYITVVDNRGRTRIQHVEYIVLDVRKEQVYITADGLTYAEDSLAAKDFHYLIEKLDDISNILVHPDIVIRDHTSPDDTLVYYRRLYVTSLGIYQLIAVVVKVRQGIKFSTTCIPRKVVKSKGIVKACHLKFGTLRLMQATVTLV